MDDNSEMLFGKFKGEKLANVPASYLLWARENINLGNGLKTYIDRNMEELLEAAKKARHSED